MPYNSIVTYTGDGSTTEYNFSFTGGYDSQAHVFCRVGNEVDGAGNPTYRSLTFINSGRVRIGGTVPAVGQTIKIFRRTPIDNAVNDFANGSVLSADTLDNGFKQVIHGLQEASDAVLDAEKADTSATISITEAANAAASATASAASAAASEASRVASETAKTGAETANTAAQATIATINADKVAAEAAKTAAEDASATATAKSDAITAMTASATTVISANPATATYNAVTGNMHFEIPRGLQGNAGPQGIKGDKGDVGPRGPDGAADPAILLTTATSANTLTQGYWRWQTNIMSDLPAGTWATGWLRAVDAGYTYQLLGVRDGLKNALFTRISDGQGAWEAWQRQTDDAAIHAKLATDIATEIAAEMANIGTHIVANIYSGSVPVGMHAMVRWTGSGTKGLNDTASGSNIRISNAGGGGTFAPAGTWRFLGNPDNTDNTTRTVIAVRIA